MPKGYQQLTYEQRCQIHALKASQLSNRKIAKQLGVNSRTIDRELTRNSSQQGYDFEQADNHAQQRRKLKTRQLKMTPELITLVEEKLTQFQWSPEQIAGWLQLHYGKQVISHERIYQHIWADETGISRNMLYMFERGESHLTVPNFIRLLWVLGCSFEDFIVYDVVTNEPTHFDALSSETQEKIQAASEEVKNEHRKAG
jgi:IS30 family transposase